MLPLRWYDNSFNQMETPVILSSLTEGAWCGWVNKFWIPRCHLLRWEQGGNSPDESCERMGQESAMGAPSLEGWISGHLFPLLRWDMELEVEWLSHVARDPCQEWTGHKKTRKRPVHSLHPFHPLSLSSGPSRLFLFFWGPTGERDRGGGRHGERDEGMRGQSFPFLFFLAPRLSLT